MIHLLADVMPILLKAAPTIASVVGSPIAGVGINLLENALGVEHGDIAGLVGKIADPGSEHVLSDLDSQHSSWLTQLLKVKMPSSIEINIKFNWQEPV
jgi:hypothetical protein